MLKALFYPDVNFDRLFIPYIYKEIYFDGVYLDILNQRKDMVIVDVGANIGIVTDYMRPHAKVIYAIEPATEHFEALKKNKEYNHWDNVQIFNMAIGDHEGKEKLYINKYNHTCHSLAMIYDGEKYEEVKTMSLEGFFKENNIQEVDFMKFDVEGAENAILGSDDFKRIAPKIKSLEVEFHYKNWKELVDYLVSLGYTARRYDCSAIVVLFTRT